MTIKFRSRSVFDAEGVCPGDILLRKGTENYYFVVESNIETEEFLCVKKVDKPLPASVIRIGYETIDLYTKVNIYDADSE